MTDLIVDIAVGVSVNKTFHYHIPAEMNGRLVLGSRVLVPFGSRRIAGTVIGFSNKTDVAGLKSIIEILDYPLMTELLTLARWMSDYYMYPLGQTIEALVPKAVSRAKPKKKKYIRLLSIPLPGGESGKVRGKKQAELVRLLSELGEMASDELPAFSSQTIRSLCNARIVEIIERETPVAAAPEGFTPSIPPVLMPEQSEAVQGITEAVAAKRFERIPAPWRDRERQDRGLSPDHQRGSPIRVAVPSCWCPRSRSRRSSCAGSGGASATAWPCFTAG